MQSFKVFVCLFAFIFLAQSVFAQSRNNRRNTSRSYIVYLEYQEGCLEEFEYKSSTGETYTTFHLPLSIEKRVIFDVNKPKSASQSTIDNTVSCADFVADERLVSDINRNRTKLYLVKRRGSGYERYSVVKAGFIHSTSDFIDYQERDFSFLYNFSQPSGSDTDLADRGSRSMIRFKGTQRSSDCAKKYIFHEVFNDAKPNDFVKIVLVHGLGVVEKEWPRKPPMTTKRTEKLIKANGKPISTYYRDFCKKMAENRPNDYDGDDKTIGGKKARTEWEKEGLGRIYLDLNSGLYIDRMTYTPATLDLAGYRYINGKQYELQPYTPPQAGNNVPPLNPQYPYNHTAPTPAPATACNVIYQVDKQIYFDLATNKPADGTCGGIIYSNGRRVGSLYNEDGTPIQPLAAPEDPNCFVFWSNNGYYVDSKTGLPANTTCKGKTYQNGQLVQTGYTGTPNTGADGNCTRVSSHGTHIVQRGETLYAISRKYGLSIAQLRAWNNLPGDEIYPCMALRTLALGAQPATYNYQSDILTRPPVPETRPVTTYNNTISVDHRGYHIVKPGETLFSISKQYGMSESRLKALNSLTHDYISPGEKLKVTEIKEQSVSDLIKEDEKDKDVTTYSYTTGQIFPGAKKAAPKTRIYKYTVEKGDTLSKIANRFGTTVVKIKEDNNLKSDLIRRGQVLDLNL